MDRERKKFQQGLIDHLEDQIAIVQRVLEYLEKEKKCHNINSRTIYKIKKLLNMLYRCHTLLSQKESVVKKEEAISISAKENIFKGQSVKEIVNQCLSFDHANHTEIIKAYPLQLPVGLVTSPKLSRRRDTHHGMHVLHCIVIDYNSNIMNIWDQICKKIPFHTQNLTHFLNFETS